MKQTGELITKKLFSPPYLLAILFIALFSSCSKDDVTIDPIPETEPRLESYELLAEIPKTTLQFLVGAVPSFEPFASEIEYGVSIYRVSYKTTYQDQEQTVSGLVSVPNGFTGEVPILSAQHPTIIANSDAPSNFDITGQQVSGLEGFGALGYATFIPDYVGYGDSEGIVHPYYNYEATATAVIDMIAAGKELLDTVGIAYNQQLFLVGYSEGGYATMATLQAIEENPDLGLQVTAAAAGAGGYDISGMFQTITSQQVYPGATYLTFLLYSYITTNSWDRPLTDFFQEPYASRLPDLFNGSLSAGPIHDQLNDTLSLIMNPTFLENVQNGSESQVTDAMEANSVADWAPQSPVRLYHTENDEVIPYANSQATYQQMVANGAANVTFHPSNLANSHNTGFLPMAEDVIPWFKSLKQ